MADSDVPRAELVAYFADLAAGLPTTDGPTATSADTTWRKVSSLVDVAGQKKMSARVRSELAQAAAAAGLHTDSPLDDPTLAPPDHVRFSRWPFSSGDLLAPNESELRRWCLSLLGKAEPFRHCYGPQIEFRIPGHRKKVDLLLKEKGAAGQWTGWVVVEFELSSPAGSVSQINEYLNLFCKTEMAEGKSLRGVIVSGSPYPPGQALLGSSHLQFPNEWWVLDAALKRLAP